MTGRANGGARAEAFAADSLGTLYALAAATAGGFLGGIVLGRVLGPTGRGEFELARTLTFVFGLVAGFGLGRAAIYFLPRGRITRGAVFGASAAAGAFGGLAAVLLGTVLFLGRGWHSLDGVQIVIACLSLPFIAFYMQAQTALRAVDQAAWYRRTLGARDVVFLAVLGLVFALHAGLTAAILAWTVHWAIGASVVGAVLARTCGRPRLPVGSARAVLAFGASQALFVLLFQAHLRLDVIVLQVVRGSYDLGQYAVAYGVAELVTFGGLAVSAALFPRTATSTVEDPAAGAERTAAAVRVVLALGTAGALALAVVGPALIRLLLGDGFAPAGTPLRLLLPGAVAMAVFSVLQSDLSGRGRVWPVAGVGAAAVASNLVLNLILVAPLGASGAAVASSLSYGLACLLQLRLFSRSTQTPVAQCLMLTPADLRGVLATLLPARVQGSASPSG